MNSRKVSNILTFEQKVKSLEIVKKYCTTTPAGNAEYRDGLDDEQVAQMATSQLGFNVNSRNIARIRWEMFGKFRASGAPKSAAVSTEVWSEIAQIRADMKILLEWCAEIAEKLKIQPPLV